jgi:protein TonB
VIQGHPLLDQAAIDAVRQWVYSPTYLNGQAIPVVTTVTVAFGLASTPPPPPPAVAPLEATNPAVQVPRREPLRVGGNVQESKLIRRVEPIYPELAKRARVEYQVMLEVNVDEEGNVTGVKVLRGHPLLDQAAIDAVKQWQYSPTYLNGQAVPVVATVTVPFTLGTGSLRLSMDPDGGLRNLADGSVASIDTLKGSNGSIIISVPPQLPFALVDQVLANLQNQGIHGIVLQGQGNYLIQAGRLFYGPGAVRGGDRLQPPRLDFYLASLQAATAKSSGLLGNAQVLSYYVYVTETGQVVGVERRGGPEIPQIEAALQQAQVLSPGRFGNEPVPAVVLVQFTFQ